MAVSELLASEFLKSRRTIEKFGLQLLEKIEEYEYISIFLHMKPDCDAYASLFSLHKWIKNNFPEKTVICWIYPKEMSEKEKILFDWNEKIRTEIAESTLKHCLGIIVDTPNEERILTQQHIFCKELIIIDHHPKIDAFAQLEFINHSYSSTSEILAELFIFYEKRDRNFVFEATMAKYLYSGIITDSNYLKDHVSPVTHYVLWKMLSKGVNKKEIHELIVANTLNKKLFDQAVTRNIRVTPNGLAFSIVTSRLLRKYLIDDYLSAISNLENIAGIEIWVIIIQDKSVGGWKCSIRSRDLPIDNVAFQFKGGGHKKSSAVLFKYKWECWSLIQFLDDYLVKFGYINCSDFGGFGRSWMLPFYRRSTQGWMAIKDRIKRRSRNSTQVI